MTPDRDALAALALTLEGLPRWSPTRRHVSARLGKLRSDKTMTAAQRAAEADRLRDMATKWKQHDQVARVRPPERPAALPGGRDPRPRPAAPTAPCRKLEDLVNAEGLVQLDQMLEGS